MKRLFTFSKQSVNPYNCSFEEEIENTLFNHVVNAAMHHPTFLVFS